MLHLRPDNMAYASASSLKVFLGLGSLSRWAQVWMALQALASKGLLHLKELHFVSSQRASFYSQWTDELFKVINLL